MYGYHSLVPRFLELRSLESWNLQTWRSTLSWATDLGSGYPLTCSWESRVSECTLLGLHTTLLGPRSLDLGIHSPVHTKKDRQAFLQAHCLGNEHKLVLPCTSRPLVSVLRISRVHNGCSGRFVVCLTRRLSLAHRWSLDRGALPVDSRRTYLTKYGPIS